MKKLNLAAVLLFALGISAQAGPAQVTVPESGHTFLLLGLGLVALLAVRYKLAK